MPKMDAAYILNYMGEGVCLEIIQEMGGAPPPLDCVLADLERRGLKDYNPVETVIRLRKGEGSLKIAPPQEEKACPAAVFVRFDKDDQGADMMLFPPVSDGAEMSADAVLCEIKQRWAVTSGLDENAVAQAVAARRYCQLVRIAEGKPAQKGKDGSVTLLFKTQHNYAPKILPDGNADYKNLDIFETVHENEAVAITVPPEKGEDGYTVKGKTLPAQDGKPAVLPKGKNVAPSEDGSQLIATRSGRVDLVNGRVEVSDVLVIKNDVDMHVGNIDFTGDVIVQGDVLSGFTVKAAGMIEVRGIVNAATLIAGKDIILKNGFQGVGRGVLKAEGSIVARFIEKGFVETKGNLFSDYIVHSTVVAEGTVTMKGKWGKIIGGHIRAGREIMATQAGSPSGDATTLEVGVAPEVRARLTEMENRRIQHKTQIDRMDNMTRVLPSREESEERLALRQKLLDARNKLGESYDELMNEISELKQHLAALSGGKVHVRGTAFADVKIIIDSSFYYIQKPLEYVTFKFEDGAVLFTSCELKNG